MPSYLPHSTPWMLILLVACAADAPSPAIPAPSRSRGPSSGLSAAPDIHESVRQLTARGPDSLDVSPGPIPGSRVMRVRSGYGEVLLAKTNPDGTVSTRCVDSVDGADAFLSDSSSNSPAQAAQ